MSRFIHPCSLDAPDPPIQEMTADFPAISNTSPTPPTSHSRPTLLILRHIQLGSWLPTSSRIARDLGSDLDIIHPAFIKPVRKFNLMTFFRPRPSALSSGSSKMACGFSRAHAVMSVTSNESTTRLSSGTYLPRLLLCLLII